MSDTTELMHAAMLQYEEDERQATMPKKKKNITKPKPKPENMKNEVLWDNLQFLDEQTKKIDTEAKKYIKDYKVEDSSDP